MKIKKMKGEIMRKCSIMFFLIISSSVLGSEFKGNVLLKFPREVNNMETGVREVSEPKIEIPIISDYWSPPDFSLGNWKCEFKRDDLRNSSTVMVKCYVGNKFSTEGNSTGILTMYSCGRDSEQYVINLWNEGVDRHISIYCDEW